MLGFSTLVIVTYSYYDPARYPLLVALPASLSGLALIDAGMRRLENRLRSRPNSWLAEVPGSLPLVLVMAFFVIAPLSQSLSELPVAWKLYQKDRASPVPLAAWHGDLHHLCKAMHPDAIVASFDPWAVLVACGNAGVHLPVDLHDPKHPELLERFLLERKPSYFLLEANYPPASRRALLAHGMRTVATNRGRQILEVDDPPVGSRPWNAPPPLRCAGRPRSCTEDTGR